ALLEAMRGSVTRMTGMVNDLLDLARGQMGGGFPTRRSEGVDVVAVVNQVVGELKIVHPDRDILIRAEVSGSPDIDGERIAQLLSNLLGNAITHGAVGSPIEVRARSDADQLELEVVNGGAAIPADVLDHLFEPFSHAGEPSEGLGLGLFIAEKIAQAHNGVIRVTSTDDE